MFRFWLRGGKWQAPLTRQSTARWRRQLALEKLEDRNLLNFTPVFTAPVGAQPDHVISADFNGDGIPDLAVTNSGGDSVSILLGQGDGTFTPAGQYPVPPGPIGIAAADVNGDGNLDLIVASPRGNAVTLLLGRGDGTFQNPRVVAGCTGCHDVAAADFNGDGIPDLAVTNSAGFVDILFGRGDGTFQPAGRYPVRGQPTAIQVGDLNSDGILDVVTANMNTNSVSILYGRGDGQFQAGPSYPVGVAPMSVAIGDVDGDGLPDIVTADFGAAGRDSSVSVLHNNGDGTFLASRIGMGNTVYWDVIVINGVEYPVGPGRGSAGLDVAIAASGFSDNQIHLFSLNQSGGFSEIGHYPVGAGPAVLAADDFNGDGLTDMAVTNSVDNTVTVLLQTAPGAPGSKDGAPSGQTAQPLGTELSPPHPTAVYVSPTAQTPTTVAHSADAGRALAPVVERGLWFAPASLFATLRGKDWSMWTDFFVEEDANLLSLLAAAN